MSRRPVITAARVVKSGSMVPFLVSDGVGASLAAGDHRHVRRRTARPQDEGRDENASAGLSR